MSAVAETTQETEGKYLTFSLGNEQYGIGILKVREIIGLMEVTPVPQTPEYIKGVINLRGKVIPILDIRTRFGMDEAEHTDRTCFIVVEMAAPQGEQLLVGIVVDSVSEVMNIGGDYIENPPAFGAEVDTEFILGMAKTADDVKILLDIDRVLSGEEMAMLGQA